MTWAFYLGGWVVSILAVGSLLMRLPEAREVARMFGFLIGFWILLVAALT